MASSVMGMLLFEVRLRTPSSSDRTLQPVIAPISDVGISRLRSADPFRDPKLSATMPPIGLGGGVVALGGTALAWFAMAFSHGIN